jgi:LuxR family transcriptional regulator, maltose regulon positive regulatory protein
LMMELGFPPLGSLVLPVECFTAWLRYKNGQQDQAMDWLNVRYMSLAQDVAASDEPAMLDAARLLELAGRPEEAITLLEKISSAARSGGRMRTFLAARILLAKSLTGQGSKAAALKEIHAILPLAEPEKYISSWLDDGETLRLLLLEAQRRLPAGELWAYVERILTAFDAADSSGEKQQAVGSGAPALSDRELEILTLAAQGLSNPEIADRLVISITTVKTHMGNIFNKLGAGNRLQAIARAETLGLLPRH